MFDLSTIKLVGGKNTVEFPASVLGRKPVDTKRDEAEIMQNKLATLGRIISDIKRGDKRKSEMCADMKTFLKKNYIDNRDDDECI